MVKVKLLYYLSWENKFVNPNGKIDLKRNLEAVGNAINDQFDSISKLANPNGQTYFETSVSPNDQIDSIYDFWRQSFLRLRIYLELRNTNV